MNILFLDLEDTVIEPVPNGWANTHMINTDKIEKFIVDKNITDLRIFSFAVWDQKQKSQFEFWVQKAIERRFGMSFSQVPTIDDDILPACCKQKGLVVELTEFSDMVEFWGKDLSFILCMKEWFKNNKEKHEVFLLDDSVNDMSFDLKQENIVGHIINIDLLT
jgi:hypothetical protein